MKKAFTLIELLVVVLIIGILAAIALPQYQVAVEKSRAAEAISNISTMQKQIELYILENGLPSSTTFYKDFASVDLSGGEWEDGGHYTYRTKNFEYYAPSVNYGSIQGGYIEVNRRDGSYGFVSSNSNLCEASNIAGWYNCCYTQRNDLGRKICKQYESLGYKYIDSEL